MRLDKYISHALNITRKNSRQIIKSNEVMVNFKIVNDPGYFLDEDYDKVIYQDRELTYHEFIYLMLNKPQDFVSATVDNLHKTVIDLLSSEYKKYDPFPVGRLDIDTEGLLIITNNGRLNHFLTSPNHQVPKKYYAKINGVVTSTDITAFRNGLNLIDGKNTEYMSLPADLEIIHSGDISEVYVTISEGKFHQVKKMFHKVDKEVIYLKRVKIKDLTLDENLEPGQYRELTNEEIHALKKDFNI